jgi:membrane protease YdiL (CAAX protease family)
MLNSSLSAPLMERPTRNVVWPILIGAAIMFVILQAGITWLIPIVDWTWGAFITTAAMLAVAFGMERIVFGRSLGASANALGWTRPHPRALLVAALLCLPMLAFFPIIVLGFQVPLALRTDWLWILLGVIAFNGLAEETLWRGFIFGHLRQAGLSFVRAGMVALAIFTAVHLLLFAQNPFIVALAATLVALLGSFPLAFLYERAGFSIWPVAILHVATHFIRLVSIPEPQAMTVTVAWLGLLIGMPLLILAFHRYLSRE